MYYDDAKAEQIDGSCLIIGDEAWKWFGIMFIWKISTIRLNLFLRTLCEWVKFLDQKYHITINNISIPFCPL